MTYNTPTLVNVDTAFNVVLGNVTTLEKDHSTERSCEEINGNSSTVDGDCLP